METNLLDAIEEAINAVSAAVNELPRVRATEIGLGGGCGSVYVDTENCLIISDRPRSLDYYGGFEYIKEDCYTIIGDYKIYGVEEHDRVTNAIEYFKQHHEDKQE